MASVANVSGPANMTVGAGEQDWGEWSRDISNIGKETLLSAEQANNPSVITPSRVSQPRNMDFSEQGLKLMHAGQFNEALESFEKGLKQEMEKNKDPEKIAEYLGHKAKIYVILENVDQAIVCYKEGLVVLAQAYGKKDTKLCELLANLGFLMGMNQAHEEAKDYFLQIVDILAKDPNNPLVYRALTGLAIAALSEGEIDQGIEYLQQAIQKATLQNNHKELGVATFLLGKTYIQLQKFEEAQKALRLSYQMNATIYGEEHELTKKVANTLISVQRASMTKFIIQDIFSGKSAEGFGDRLFQNMTRDRTSSDPLLPKEEDKEDCDCCYKCVIL